MSLSELRKELKALRKEHVKPVSRMKKADCADELDRLRRMREETPAAAAVPSAPMRKSKMAVESIKEAKRMEFPVKPAEKMMPKAAAAPKKKGLSKSALRAMLEELTSDEEA
jgi:hypothetical protein